MKIICVGGGISGLSVAYHLQEKGHEVVIYEKESTPGGLCRTREVECFGEKVLVDYGVHAFWSKPGYWNEWVKEKLGIRLLRQNRDAKIYFPNNEKSNQLVPYPFQAHLSKLPKEIAYECLMNFITKPKLWRDCDIKTFQQWMCDKFGYGIVEHFIKPYNEKMWRRPLNEVSSCWVDKVPTPKLEDLLKEVIGLENKTYGGNNEFDYPVSGGVGVIATELAKKVNIKYNAEVTWVNAVKKLVKINNNATTDKYDILINTSSLKNFLTDVGRDQINDGIQEKFEYFSGYLENNYVRLYTFVLPYTITRTEHWIYFSQPEIPFYRVSFLHNFPGVCSNKLSVVQVEISDLSSKNDYNCTSETVFTQLLELGIIPQECCERWEDVIILDPAYVIFHNNYADDVKQIHDQLNKQDIFSIGRYGKWAYTSMHDCLEEGKVLAEKIG